MDGTLLNISNLFQQRGLTILPRIAQEEQTGFKLQTFGLPIVEKKSHLIIMFCLYLHLKLINKHFDGTFNFFFMVMFVVQNMIHKRLLFHLITP